MGIYGQHEFSMEELNKMQELRKLIEGCKELDVGTEDVFLAKFLTCTEWDVQKAFQKIHELYDFKLSYPDWTAKRLPIDFKAIMNIRTKYILPYTDKNGRTIYVHKIVDAFKEFPNYFFDLVEFDDLIYEAALSLPSTQRNGVSAIIDMKGLSKSFFKFMGPKTVRIANKKNDVLPFKEIHFHVVNTSILMSAAMSMIMPFLGKKMKDKMYFHGSNYDKLAEHLGFENLPSEYGGPQHNTFDDGKLYDFLFENEEYLKQLQTYKKIKK